MSEFGYMYSADIEIEVVCTHKPKYVYANYKQ